MNIPEEVKRVLDEQSISHGRLRLNASSQSKHHAVTDYERVYVKMLKPGTITRASMLKAEVDFSIHTEYGTNPLMEKIIHKNSKGTIMVMSAWEFEHQVPITYNLNPMQIAQAANELFLIHSFPKYDTLRTNTEEEFQEYLHCLTSYSFKFLNAVHQDLIKKLYYSVVQPGTQALVASPETNVLCHGEAVLEKIVMKPSGVQWVDYESVRSAPREYDIARIYIQLHHRLGKTEYWHIFKNQYESKLGRPLDYNLLERFAYLHLARRTLQVASKTLHDTDQKGLLSLLRELTAVTNGKARLSEAAFTHLKIAQ